LDSELHIARCAEIAGWKSKWPKFSPRGHEWGKLKNKPSPTGVSCWVFVTLQVIGGTAFMGLHGFTTFLDDVLTNAAINIGDTDSRSTYFDFLMAAVTKNVRDDVDDPHTSDIKDGHEVYEL
jgi:hypothetical protein